MTSARIYAWLLRLYPAQFRARYGRDMRDLFSDLLTSSRRDAGVAGVIRLWLRTLSDVVRHAALEHVATRRPRPAHPPLPAARSGRRHDMLEAIRHDARYAARMLRRSPAFTAAAVLVIALGTGGVTTIYSAMNAVLLRPLPGTTQPDALVDIGRTLDNGSGSLSASYPYYAAVRDGARTVDGVAAWSNVSLSIAAADGGAGDAVAAEGNIVTGNYFEVLGASPALGRFFTPDEDRTPLTHPVVVLSHDFWRSQFGADSGIIGRTVRVNAQPFTVIGVAEPEFRGVFIPLRTDAWVPIMMQPLLRPGRALNDADAAWLRMFARLDEGATHDAARAEIGSITAAFATGDTEAADFRTLTAVKLSAMSGLPDDAHRAALAFMALLLGAASLVLLIASVNVAGMLSARALGRRREMAVRAALGAARGRLVRQLLTETLLLFAMGAMGGMAIAMVATRALERVPVPGDVSLALMLTPDARVFAFAVVVALMTGLVFGITPALQAAQRDITSRLRDGSTGSGVRRGRFGSTLVVGQLALSLVLLVAAGLFARALERGQAMDTGFDVMNVATTSLNTASWGYDEARARTFFRVLRERVEAIPGVTAVSTAGFLPLALGSSGGDIEVNGVEINIESVNVDRGYFDVLRLPIVGGRPFTATDDASAPRVAVINEALAHRHWPDGDAIGSTFTARGTVVRVAGIARDAKYADLSAETPSFAYFPMAQRWSAAQTLIVRTAGDPAAIAPVLRAVVAELDPAVPPPAISTLARETSMVLLPQRVAAAVTGALGMLGLILAAVGLYGVMAFAAGRRTREIGIRMAVGAHRADVLRMMMRDGLRLAGIGIITGLALAAIAARFMATLLFGVSPLDAVTFAGMATVLVAVAVVATWLPARRAAAADPMVVLRND